jgi:hypothetical protein
LRPADAALLCVAASGHSASGAMGGEHMGCPSSVAVGGQQQDAVADQHSVDIYD